MRNTSSIKEPLDIAQLGEEHAVFKSNGKRTQWFGDLGAFLCCRPNEVCDAGYCAFGLWLLLDRLEVPLEIFYGLLAETSECLENSGPAIPDEQETDIDVEKVVHAVTFVTPRRSNTSLASR